MLSTELVLQRPAASKKVQTSRTQKHHLLPPKFLDGMPDSNKQKVMFVNTRRLLRAEKMTGRQCEPICERVSWFQHCRQGRVPQPSWYDAEMNAYLETKKELGVRP